ncbi:phosphotransferase family protein [Actinorugispora endophytica]|uniref:Phosphotransferase family enzyme n=1 Tax=Actinorugispora endophytica TaxID=1605990 RepID=A0A4R6V6C0_9ACTN|nr:aminoglycoside phosphotransferase family protein [Actinorugispora endophytica]TDQ54415.1 phosphotransferase family enzyme [Actinorugispora endophytica]
MTIPEPYDRILAEAGRRAGVATAGAEVVRIGENAVLRLPGKVVARISRLGQDAAAAREVAVARWLADQGVPAVRALAIDQPAFVCGRAVTWWEELPPHGPGTVTDAAVLISALHALTPPADLNLGRLDPFVRLDQRIDDATTLAENDRAWLRGHLDQLRAAWRGLPQGLPERVVHGDAWVGNIARTEDGEARLMDLERCSLGRPEWDLVSTAIKHTSFGWVSAPDYERFVEVYGYDVTAWDGFEVMRDVRELRMTLYFAQHASGDPVMDTEAKLRLDSLRGGQAPRPWTWTPSS